jgi:hypothetical protein
MACRNDPGTAYDPAGTTFHGWRAVYAFPRDVSVELTLEPRRARDPVGSFVVGLKRIGPRWLVDGIYEEGTHGGESAAAPAATTTVARATTEHVVGGSGGRLSGVWLLVPLGLLSMIVIVPIAVFTRRWWNDWACGAATGMPCRSSCRRFLGATRAEPLRLGGETPHLLVCVRQSC